MSGAPFLGRCQFRVGMAHCYSMKVLLSYLASFQYEEPNWPWVPTQPNTEIIALFHTWERHIYRRWQIYFEGSIFDLQLQKWYKWTEKNQHKITMYNKNWLTLFQPNETKQKVNILCISKSIKFYFQIDNFHINFSLFIKKYLKKKSIGNR